MSADPVRTRGEGDEGAALMLVLVLVTIIGIVVAGLLSQAEAQFKANQRLDSRRDGQSAADAGIDHAIETVDLFVPVQPAQEVCNAPGANANTPGTITCPMIPTADGATVGGVPQNFSQTEGRSPRTFQLRSSQPRGANRTLVVTTYTDHLEPVDSVTYQGVALRSAGRLPHGGSQSDAVIEFWYLLDADLPANPTPSGNIVVTSVNDDGDHQLLSASASMWYGTYQAHVDTAYGPQMTPGFPLVTQTNSITTPVDILQDNTLAIVAAGHTIQPQFIFFCQSAGMQAPTGRTRMSVVHNDEGSDLFSFCGTTLGTSWVRRNTENGVEMNDTFSGQGDPTVQAILTLTAAQWGGTEQATVGCVDNPVVPITYNEFTVTSVCQPLTADGVLVIESTAARPDGFSVKSQASIRIDPAEGMFVERWTSRVSAI